MANEEPLLFEGLKVLDVGSWIAGPVAATILADFGASVIKIENPGSGDGYRRMAQGLQYPKTDINYSWLADARNKRSLSLNLKSDEGHEILLRLVRECDVYVTNQPPPLRAALGLTYADLAPVNPRMIYASLTAYGETGPDSELEGFDAVTYWARSGLMDQVRSAGAMPGPSVPGMGDHPSAVSLYAAIVTALIRRDRTGKGSEVHTSLLHNGIWSNACYVQAALVGADFTRRTIVSPNRSLYETSDGRLLQLYMVRTQEEVDRLLVASARDDLLADGRFDEPAKRMANAAAFIEELSAMFRTKTAAEWMTLFRETNVPVTWVATMEEIPHDIQMTANGMFVPPSDPSVPAALVINHPVNITGLPMAGPLPAPDLGEHTDEILAEMGFAPADITSLRNRQVV